MSMTPRFKRILTAALSLALALSLGVPVFAAEENAAPACSVTLNVTDEGGQRQDLAETVLTVDVWKVATLEQAGGAFSLTEQFASLAANAQWNGGVLSASTAMQDLLDAALAVLAADPEAAPDMQAQTQAVGGTIQLPGMGLYLLAPQDAQTSTWEYTFSSILLAVPAMDQESGQFVYECDITMKPERDSRLAEIIIEKTLREYNATLGPTTFLFEVRGVLNGEVVYSNIVPLTFLGVGTQSVTVSGIPAGADVTVTEVYSGGSYDVVDGRVSVTVEDLPIPQDGVDPQRVAFTNDYNDRRTPDSSVTNTFTYNGTGWHWESNEEAGQ